MSNTRLQSHEYKHRILLAVIGKTPQLVTETLCKLAINDQQPIDNQFYSTDDATIILSDIPYVRMRYHVPEKLLQGQAGFQQTVDKIQRFMQPEQGVFKIIEENLMVMLNGEALAMSAAEFTFYLWMCQRKKNAEPPLVLEADSFMDEYLALYKPLVGEHSGRFEKIEEIASSGTVKQQVNWFRSSRTKVKRSIINALGDRFAQPFLIQTIESEGVVAYEVNLPSHS